MKLLNRIAILACTPVGLMADPISYSEPPELDGLSFQLGEGLNMISGGIFITACVDEGAGFCLPADSSDWFDEFYFAVPEDLEVVELEFIVSEAIGVDAGGSVCIDWTLCESFEGNVTYDNLLPEGTSLGPGAYTIYIESGSCGQAPLCNPNFAFSYEANILAIARPPSCPTDLTGDGTVGAADLAELLGGWGPNPGHPADFDGDDLVDAADLAQLLGTWGSCD